MADLMDEAIEISHKLIPCNICGRTFLPSPLKKHAKVCEKNATRKRKTFNSLKQRIEGTELAAFHHKSLLRKSENLCPTVAVAPHVHAPPPPPVNEQKRNQSKWKEKHEQLVRAIRAAKGEKVMAPRRSISAVGSMGTTEQCPTCDRHFGPKAYDRHVEWCKEHKIRASKSPAVVTIAKERLEARTKYRVPPLNKSKRSLTRDKYSSPSSNRNQETVMNVRSTSSLEQPTSHTRKTKHHQKNKTVPPQSCPPLAEPVIKHNAEKLKSFGKGSSKSENKKHPLSPLKRSVSLSNPVVKARSMRNKQDIQDYLHVREQKPSSREKLKALSPRSSDELFPAGHDMYNEYKKYEEMYRREQDEVENSARELDENDDSSNEDCTPPLPERNYQTQQQQMKMQAGDSAYGSLNRKSPKSQQAPPPHSRQSKVQHVKRSPSSSGSETCTSLPAKKSNRLTKFCHECGTKYPLDSAKFCVECGIKRLVL